MTAEMEGWYRVKCICILKSLNIGIDTLLATQASHCFAEISVNRGIVQTDGLSNIIAQNPRENWILSQIFITSSTEGIELHQIFKV